MMGRGRGARESKKDVSLEMETSGYHTGKCN